MKIIHIQLATLKVTCRKYLKNREKKDNPPQNVIYEGRKNWWTKSTDVMDK